MGNKWPSIGHETIAWESDPDIYALLSRRQRLRISSTYEAALPLDIAKRQIDLSAQTRTRIADLLVRLSRFDSEQSTRAYSCPDLLLRSESAASSQIEHLTASARNVALAQIDRKASGNAKLIARNIDAMREALALDGLLDASGIMKIHGTLMADEEGPKADGFRQEQVWIGGTSYSPHEALYVPPAHERVEGYIDDMLAFAQRDDMDPITKVSIVHAQFETIHPFTDGNGRTGRTLLHKVLKDEEVLPSVTLPVSAGLLHNIDDYMNSLKAYQDGNPEEVVMQVIDALETALYLGQLGMKSIDTVIEDMHARIDERCDSAIHGLPALLVTQPVIDSAYIERELGVSNRTALTVIEKACGYGILKRIGNKKREARFQSDEVLRVLDELSDIKRLRRVKINS